jgi:serine/threonine protein kinase
MTPSLYTSRSYVIDGLSFEVDARYTIRSMVGKGAYGLVCAGEDTRPPPETEPTASSSPVVPSSSDNSFDARTPDAQYDARSPGNHAAAEAASTRARPAPAMVAVKKVLDPFHDHTDCKRLLREVRLLRSLRHPNVLHLTDLMPPPSLSPADWTDVYLVTRLFDTNLHRVIYSGHTLTDAHVQYILWQVFRALRYLHTAGVVHRDMKPTNLLLNRDCELALADFGLARLLIPYSGEPHVAVGHRRGGSGGGGGGGGGEGDTPPAEPRSKSGQLTRYVVTRWYRAPELLVQNRVYDFKVDMWSVGCILAELLGVKALFPGKDSLHQLRLVVEQLGVPTPEELLGIHNEQAVQYIRNLVPRDPAGASPAAAAERFARLYPRAHPLLLDLLAQLLHFDPKKRPSAAEALAHPYLAAYRDAPEEVLPIPEIEMGFESEAPTKETLRQLIWEEVLRYHPHLARPLPGSRTA